MKLGTVEVAGGEQVLIGVIASDTGSDRLVRLTDAYALTLVERGEPFARDFAAVRIPNDMCAFLSGGEQTLAAAEAALEGARAAIQNGNAESWHRAGVLLDPSEVRFLPPVTRPGKIISVGSNYAAHVAEADSAGANVKPSEDGPHYPPAFPMFASTMVGHEQPIERPTGVTTFDYEAELCIVIGRRCKDVAVDDYLDCVAGFTIINDVSMREIQMAEMKRGMLLMGKNLDTTAPVGPYLVTVSDIGDPGNLRIRCWVNGGLRQDDTTASMIFSPAEIVSYYSRMTLEPGDMIATGTPAGVAFGAASPTDNYLKPGDVVEIEIREIGRLRNTVVDQVTAGASA